MSMDRPIARKRRSAARLIIIALAVAAVAFLGYRALAGGRQKPAASRMAAGTEATVAEVTRAGFQEFIQVNAFVAAVKTVLIDAKEGGTVKRVAADKGDVVEAGEVLAELESPQLESELALKESALASESAKARSDELRLERQDVEARRSLLEADRKIDELERDVARKESLVEAGGAARNGLEDARAELDYARRGKTLLQRLRELDQDLLRSEAERSKGEVDLLRLERDDLARRKAGLRIVAPALGQIASFSASVGETMAAGSRVAELDIMDDLRLRSDVDEYYLPRMKVGLRGSFEVEDAAGGPQRRGMAVTWVSPNVKNSAFEVEFSCDGGSGGLRVGQRFAARVELGESREAVVIPMGPFYRDSGGSWVYVVDPSGRSATRRAIEAGRSNPDYLEILGGLSPGEKVVVSGYSGYGASERISLKGGSSQ